VVPDIGPGPAQVVITASGGRQQFGVTVAASAPAFFVWPGSQAAATRADYTLAAKAGTFAGATTVRRRDHSMGHRLWTHHSGGSARRPASGRPDLRDKRRSNDHDQQHEEFSRSLRISSHLFV
jgi:hypothetical protein